MLEEKIEALTLAIQRLITVIEVERKLVSAPEEDLPTPAPVLVLVPAEEATLQKKEVTLLKEELQDYCLQRVRAEAPASKGQFKSMLLGMLKQYNVRTIGNLPNDKAAADIYTALINGEGNQK